MSKWSALMTICDGCDGCQRYCKYGKIRCPYVVGVSMASSNGVVIGCIIRVSGRPQNIMSYQDKHLHTAAIHKGVYSKGGSAPLLEP